MESRKLTKEDLDKVRDLEGFPIGEDEDIIALSDAPYYTACPNPFVGEFIKENGTAYDETTDDYHREPFASDVSEGKGDIIYGAHNYHTKVPYKAIMRYIMHYTNPGDIVYDGFCGTGMTGVAAQLCGSNDVELEQQLRFSVPNGKWGKRKAVLNDLSPIATFISYNQNTSVNTLDFEKEASRILLEFERDYGWMYQTNHNITNSNGQVNLFNESSKGFINYTVWSDVFVCPHCSNEFTFSKVAFDFKTKRVQDSFSCPYCKSIITKKECDNAKETFFDEFLQETVQMAKQEAVLINYTFGGKKYEKEPDEEDLRIIRKIQETKIPFWTCMMYS